MMDSNQLFVANILTSSALVTLVGVLFWAYLNTKFKDNDDLKKEVRDIRERFVLKEDHREDKGSIEKRLDEITRDLKRMPADIVNMLKQFIK